MTLRAIGIMSGTSADGADAVLLEVDALDRRGSARVIDHAFVPYSGSAARLLQDPVTLDATTLAELHVELAAVYAEVAQRLSDFGSASVVGCHGQTIVHRPPSAGARTPATLQIGSSAALAARLGLPVVSDFRGADVALGGEGAPIVPVAHWFFSDPKDEPSLVVNLGGIANLTYVAGALDQVLAYDVGPGMMLSDAFAREHGMECDRDGALSRPGKVIDRLVGHALAHPFFSKTPPKSTGREEFGRGFYDELRALVPDAEREDIARSLLAITANGLRGAVSDDARMREPRAVILTGGGAKNPVLAELVRASFPASRVTVPAAGPLAPSHHEPAAMALIALRTMHRLPSGLPNVTGASRAAILGHVHHPP
jgi:anhydro-N-acetylmuramic acid kinase